MTEAQARVFGTRSTRTSQIVICAAYAGFVTLKLLLCFLYVGVLRDTGADTGTTFLQNLTYFIVICKYPLFEVLFFLLVFVVALWQIRLETARAQVELDETGLTVTDWHGRTKSVAWNELETLHLQFPLYRGRAQTGASAIRLRGAGRKLTIPYAIGTRDELAAEIVARAGLNLTAQGWAHQVYTRPAGT